MRWVAWGLVLACLGSVEARADCVDQNCFCVERANAVLDTRVRDGAETGLSLEIVAFFGDSGGFRAGDSLTVPGSGIAVGSRQLVIGNLATEADGGPGAMRYHLFAPIVGGEVQCPSAEFRLTPQRAADLLLGPGGEQCQARAEQLGLVEPPCNDTWGCTSLSPSAALGLVGLGAGLRRRRLNRIQ